VRITWSLVTTWLSDDAVALLKNIGGNAGECPRWTMRAID
jgi:hypothetical protein